MGISFSHHFLVVVVVFSELWVSVLFLVACMRSRLPTVCCLYQCLYQCDGEWERKYSVGWWMNVYMCLCVYWYVMVSIGRILYRFFVLLFCILANEPLNIVSIGFGIVNWRLYVANLFFFQIISFGWDSKYVHIVYHVECGTMENYNHNMKRPWPFRKPAIHMEI